MEPLTINGPIPFGRQRDGTLAAASMRQACVAVAGEPGSGKTIVEHNLCCGLIRCPDALVWIVDLSRGGLANPYLNPWLDGDLAAPPVDWVATDLGEAHAMTEAAVATIGERRAAYRQFMARRRVDKLPLTHDLPAVYLLIDEGKKVTGSAADPKLLRKIITIADEGRAMGVRLVITGLRATSEVIPSELMADIGCRIGMSVASAAEANYFFGWNHRPNPRDTPYPGCGLWRHGLGGPPVPFRSFNLSDPDRIAEVAMACEPWRPTLDEPSLNGLSPELRDWYVSRWERAAEGLGGPGSPGPAQPVSRPSWAAHGAVDLAPMQAAVERARRLTAAEQRKASIDVGSEWDRLSRELDDDRAAGGEGWREPADDGQWEPRALQILAANATGGVSGLALLRRLAADGHDVPKSTLYDWLGRTATRISPTRWGPPETRSDP